jgi:hypothetical protein
VQVAAFVRRRMAALRKVDRAELLRIVEWYRCVAGLGVMRVDGKIVAVAMARCVPTMEAAQAEEWLNDEEGGKIVWVQHIASLHPRGIETLLRQAMRRFGQREAFAGSVFSRAGELRMLPWNVVARLTMENSKNGLSTEGRGT